MDRIYTSKQMGDACEMLVAAELTLAGIPSLKVPDNWPGYDIVAQPPGSTIQRISVKSRTYKVGASFLNYDVNDNFDWLAIVLLECPYQNTKRREIYILPKSEADKLARKNQPGTKTVNKRYWSLVEISKVLAKYKDNFKLSEII